MNDVRQLTDSMRSHSPSAMNLKLVLNTAAVVFVVATAIAAAGGVGGNGNAVIVVVFVAALSIPHVKTLVYINMDSYRARSIIFFLLFFSSYSFFSFTMYLFASQQNNIVVRTSNNVYDVCTLYRFVCLCAYMCLNVCSITDRSYSLSLSLFLICSPTSFHLDSLLLLNTFLLLLRFHFLVVFFLLYILSSPLNTHTHTHRHHHRCCAMRQRHNFSCSEYLMCL